MEQSKQRYLCVHGHFYQPPREHPWLEAVEIQDSAHPYHDWNERITAECYAPNSASRILDGDGHLMDIVSNYAKMSFNFGPTVLSWMEHAFPEVYQSILNADKQSLEWRSGHGAALAQVFNHMIMPLANPRDQRAQVIWGIKDFEARFQRFPEGMWLAETAVDTETLEVLAEQRIKFTILAPSQAKAYRKTGDEEWIETNGNGTIDPTRAYLCKLPSGRSITLFFYDGPISQAIAFENLLSNGDSLTNRVVGGFRDDRDWPQLMHLATDGETYGHHQRFGDMALAHALHAVEASDQARITNYGEFLADFPPEYEAQISERTAWSCVHGVERWNSDCGCNSGGNPGWNQQWRRPLRAALDWLRDQLAPVFERKGKEFFRDPWQAREAYIEVILDRSRADSFLDQHAAKPLAQAERVAALKLMEMQRHAMYMYTSCGWFFDELSGVETVQVINYAGRALQLAEEWVDPKLEASFKEKLSEAKCNYEEYRDGKYLYEMVVLRTRLSLASVGIHYAFSSLFEEYNDEAGIYCFRVHKEEYTKIAAEGAALALGRISVTSEITHESAPFFFCVVRIGNHDFKGSILPDRDPAEYTAMKEEIAAAFDRGLYTDLIELMDKHFGHHNFSLLNLFTDEKRKILNLIIEQNMEEFGQSYENLFEKNRPLMTYLQETGMPVPKPFLLVAQPALNASLLRAITQDEIDEEAVHRLVDQMRSLKVEIELPDTEYNMRHHAETLMRALTLDPANLALLNRMRQLLAILEEIPLDIILWQIQNDYYELAKKVSPEYRKKAGAGDAQAQSWLEGFEDLGNKLHFNLGAVLPQA